VTRTRIELETLALRRAIELGDAGWAEGVRAAYAELAAAPLPAPGEPGPPFETWRRRHQRFHLALLAACRSEWLLRFHNVLYEQSERYRFLAHSTRSRDVDGEHRRIVEAALARDAPAAVQALAEHLALTAGIIADRIQEGRR
ncbi:MAG TPA: FCD domain-containing protein, partial [Methylomirabilota bacterium]|nr:FCD domain-containing protein [Methylomirabilota bacterium]